MNVPTAEPVSTNSKIPTAVANTVDNVSNTASSVASSVSENVNSASNYVKDSISSFLFLRSEFIFFNLSPLLFSFNIN